MSILLSYGQNFAVALRAITLIPNAHFLELLAMVIGMLQYLGKYFRRSL
jgi:hypothetical protein